MIVTAGKTNVSTYFYIVQDASATSPGEPATGLLFSDIETGGSASYMRQGGLRVDFTLITQTADGTHADGGFVLVDDTNMPGVYRCDVPDAAFATGVDHVVVDLLVAAAKNVVVAPLLIDITDVDLRDAQRAGMTALPAANAEAAGGLYTRGTGAGQINQDANGQVDANVTNAAGTAWASGAITAASIAASALNGKGDWNIGKTGYALSTAGILAIWHQAVAAIVTASSIGKLLIDEITSVRMATLTDWIDGGRLDAILDARMAEASINTTAGVVDVVALVDLATLTTTATNLTNAPTSGDLTATMKTSVQTAVDAALDTIIAELGVAVPATTPTLRTAIMLMYMALRNKLDVQTSATDALEVHNDAGTLITKKLLTDAAGDYSEAKMS